MLRAAKTLPNLQGPAAWNRILPAPIAAQRLDENITADVTIIGAGFAGLSAARRLTQIDPGVKVVVLDALPVAESSAGRNSGFMIDLPHELTSEDYAGAGDDRSLIALNRQAIHFAREAVDEYQIDANYFDPAGKVNGAASLKAAAHNESYALHLASLGEDYELLDPRQMTELTGSRHYLGGLYTPGTVMLQPAGYIRGLAAGLRRTGVSVFEESPVTSFSEQDTGWLIETPGGKVSTGKIILTVNGHLESFGYERNRLMQLFLFAVMTPDLGDDVLLKLGGQPRWGITPSDPMGTTLRRIDTGQGGNRIITRTCAVLKPDMRLTQAHVDRAAAVMQDKFDRRFPKLAGLKMKYSWAGHLCLSMNGVAVMRELEDGVYSGCVQNGLGTARGTLTGMGAAELTLGIESDITRHFGAEASPNKLPPQPFRELGANVVLRWKEWRAAEE
ncbi:NAD(P)/FAD-dependent oxidoreductase [Roseibium alexandrii]|uniref:Glycine/D-amino acid oxidase (Deaminating) n=1 Tax=Roseibium alexandrii (strain DSM 17067 / NCIMB 14079 / DFL-11) TaxID=244592 RepID=A0A5E8H5M3_ROSAD|nr:FAD-binding oxidoreductase [Roseibium alexandrii]EEE47745.1 Glycine/D-amino acid oxidase (deaminating) [Roseibium alexandrii DFL-11]